MAGEIRVRVPGLDKFKRNMKRYPGISRPIFNEKTKRCLSIIEKEAKPRTPIDTGALRGGYRQEMSDMKGEVGPTAGNVIAYAYIQHEGNFNHPRGGEQYYLKNAVEAKEKEIGDEFERGMDEIFKIISRI